MNLRTLAFRGLTYHWRNHLGVVLGVILGSAILSGALIVGDSVRFTLKSIAFLRIGETDLALPAGDRLFPVDLADRLSQELDTDVVPTLMLRGSVRRGDDENFANRVKILGVNQDFWKLSKSPFDFDSSLEDTIYVNQHLAGYLSLKEGDEVFIRVENPSLLQREAPLSSDDDTSVAARLTVRGIVSDDQLGRFDLQANQVASFNAFIPIASLQTLIERVGKANLLLVPYHPEQNLTEAQANRALEEHFAPTDADLLVQSIPDQKGIELSTERVFLETPVVQAALKAGDSHTGILTYFVNELRFGEQYCPYSMVAAVGTLGATNEKTRPGPLLQALPHDLKNDEAVINQWLADDLGLGVGDSFEVDYYVIGPLRTVEEKTTSFKVREIVPIEGPFDDPDLMPGFPGLAEAEDCRNWEPGVPIDLDKIRDKDEVYWDDHRGTPKAFITLHAGEKLWRNRYGDLTAIRYPTGSMNPESLAKTLSENIDPSSLGFRFVPVRDRALAASSPSTDFGQLFLGLSFFLIVAALLFMGLMNVFGIEQRSEEVGTLLALGFLSKQIRRVFLLEGFLLAILGSVVGVLLGIAYAKTILWGLSTVWSGSTGGLKIFFSTTATTLIISFVSGVVISFVTLWLTIRRQARIPARELLSAGAEAIAAKGTKKRSRSSWGWAVGLFLALGGGALAYRAGQDPSNTSGLFFGAGSLFLLSGLSFARAILSRSSTGESLSLVTLGTRNTSRRLGRSLTSVALLAAGSFLVISVDAYRLGPPKETRDRSSGTGGFTLYGETTLPILHNLNTEKGAEAYALTLEDLQGAEVLPMRFLEGDDASCLNLNRPQAPQILGVDPEALQSRNSFSFAQFLDEKYEEEPWRILEENREDGTIPAVADQNTVTYILHKSMGDTLLYINGKGERVIVRIVGTLAGSILQGNIIISEKHFIEKFPDISGFQSFLVDTEPGTTEEVSKNLSFGLRDHGVQIVTTAERLESFNVVQNTYLSIFQLLGGLGMILGSLGLGVVVLRNVLERRGELALLRAVGFHPRQIKRIVLIEHWWLVVLGLLIGTISGIISVLPAIGSAQHPFPYFSLSLTLLGMVLSCLILTYLATSLALRGTLLSALRND